jgi:von Willebrand factor type A domain
MSRSALALLVAGCTVVFSPLLLARQAQERVIYASVVDEATRQPVPNLGPDAFLVREDNVRREVLRVAPATSPMPIAVLVDNSQAMAPHIADLRRALTTFFSGIDGLGPVTLVTVADRPTVALGYTTSVKDMVAAANRLFHAPSSGATLLDAISDVAKGVIKRESDRAGIVVVTGEFTDYSHFHYQDVLKDLRASGAALHAVVFTNPAESLTTEEAKNRALILDRGPRESGGVRMDVLTSMSFEPQLIELAARLKSQYRVVYARPTSLIPPEKIELTSAKPGLDARGTPARARAAKP